MKTNLQEKMISMVSSQSRLFKEDKYVRAFRKEILGHFKLKTSHEGFEIFLLYKARNEK